MEECVKHFFSVSIRAPVRGATAHSVLRQASEPVSIRAPVRGATGRQRVLWLYIRCFDPRPRAGSDDHCDNIRPCWQRFRSAPPCGERLRAHHVAEHHLRFDPRPRAGSDLRGARIRPLFAPVSIRAPVRGATPLVLWPVWFRAVSIRAPVRGATLACRQTYSVEAVSIRAPVRGATAVDGSPNPGRPVSIRAPVRGATPAPHHLHPRRRVSIRAPVRGATHLRHPNRIGHKRFDPRPRAGSDAPRS